MNKELLNTIKETVNKYNNKERICGVVDCNLMILEIFEPRMFNKLKGTYTTIKQGIKQAKKLFGYRSIKEFLEKSNKYEIIPNKLAYLGDIGVVQDANCVFLHLGNKLFIVTKKDKEIFVVVDTNTVLEHVIYYRRK